MIKSIMMYETSDKSIFRSREEALKHDATFWLTEEIEKFLISCDFNQETSRSCAEELAKNVDMMKTWILDYQHRLGDGSDVKAKKLLDGSE